MPDQLYVHVITIVSEHRDYDSIEDVARDAQNGDAILRAWDCDEIAGRKLLTVDELDFFGLEV